MVDTTEFNLVPNNEEEEFTVDFGEVTRLAGSSDFNQLQNRPQYDGQVMTGETDIPKVPTATSELNNDSDYQTGSEVQQTINAAIANKQDKLTAGQNITISEQNVISATGLTEVDWGDIGGNLNDQIDLKDVLDAKQDTLTPGDNVTIANNIISATDTKYTAGNGLSLNGTQFSADTAVLQEKLDAGNAITIENNTINADIYPADFFTNEATAADTGSNITLNKTIPATLKGVELHGDTEQQTYSGKNLITFGSYSYTSTGIQLTRNGNTLTAVGTLTSNVSERFFDAGNVELNAPIPAGTYTMSMAGPASKALLVSLRRVVDGASVGVTNFVIQAGQTSATITIDYEATHYRASIQGLVQNEAVDVVFENIQIEDGSTATSYEPYVGGVPAPSPDYPQAINTVTGRQVVGVSGKNLLKLEPETVTRDGITFTPHADGSFDISGTATANTEFKSGVMPLATSGIVGGQSYTISSSAPIDSNNIVYYVHSCNENGSWNKTLLPFTNSGTRTAETPSTDYVYFVVVVNSGKTVNLTNVKTQIEAGSSATTFQPYQSQSYTVDLGSTELCKIGNYQDYIYKSGDDWYVHKEVGKQTIDGTSTWRVQNNTKTNYVYYQNTSSTFIPTGVNDVAPALSTQLIVMSGSDANNSDTSSGFAFSVSGYLRVNLPRVDFPDVAAVKSHFTANPMDVYYALATPTDTKITDAGLIADLNALAGAKSYLDVTNFNVTATGTNLPALLKPEVYVNSLHSIIELLNSYK